MKVPAGHLEHSVQSAAKACRFAVHPARDDAWFGLDVSLPSLDAVGIRPHKLTCVYRIGYRQRLSFTTGSSAYSAYQNEISHLRSTPEAVVV